MRFSHFLLLLTSIVFSYAQKPANNYRWKHLGPHTTATTLCDSGTWTAVGQGWIEDFIIEEDYWIAGAVTGGLYKSTSNGKIWSKIDTDTIQMGTTSLLKVGNTIYRGTGLTHYDKDIGIGILKSTDKGKSWQETGLKFDKLSRNPVWDIVTNASKTILAACTPTQVYISQDKGETWQMVLEDKDEAFKNLLFNADKENELWIGGKKLLLANSTTGDVQYKTPMLSASKVGKAAGITRIAICQDPNNASRFLAFYGSGRYGVLDESTDGGQTWHQLNDGKRIERADKHHTEVAIAPGDSKTIVLGTFRTYVSTDNGKTFETVTNPAKGNPRFAHDDIREIFLQSNSEFYIATDGGVFRTQNSGASWTNISGKGLVAMQIYGIEVLADKSVLMGTQDMGYFRYDEGTWTHLGTLYGDGGDALQIGGSTYLIMGGRLRKMESKELIGRAKSFHPPAGSNPFTAKLYPHTLDSSFYYVGHQLWHYTGSRWENLSEGLGNRLQMVMDIDINEKNPLQILFAYDQPTWDSKNVSNKFFKSTDGGKNWVDITSTLPILAWHHITSISTNPENADEILVSLGRMDDTQLNKVYKSTNGGRSWENYSTGLPPFETFKIQHIPGSTGLLVATLGGLYYRNQKLDSWIKLEGKIPPIAVRDFELDLVKRRLIAGTYGNGLWQMKIPRRMLKY